MSDSILQKDNTMTNQPIGWFVAFSLLLHALLFWGVVHHQTETPMPAPQQARGGLHISLQPYRVQTETQKAQTDKANPVPHENVKTARQTSTEPSPTHQEKNSHTAEATFRERIMVKLRGALAAHFVYPMLARQRNWQGEVLLAFRLEQDGRISDARIARSSGHSLLDQAALNALGTVGTLGEMLPRSLTLELPVIYRLES